MHICNSVGIKPKDFYKAITSFSGASNRLELIYKSSNSTIFKDFAHSPSKVKATSEAVRKQFPQIRLIACFELHTYSSLNPAFLNKYRDTLNSVDECYIYYSEKNMKIKRRNFFLELFIGIVAIYLIVLIFLFFFQRNLMYHPDENNYSGDNLEVNIEKVTINTTDNINLLGWSHNKNLNSYKTIVYFHGNAGTLENRIHKLNHFKDMDVNFLIIAWRGVSGNKGKPSEEGFYTDGASAINWLKEKGLSLIHI